MSRIIPYRGSDNDPIELRKIAAEKGIIAPTLEELKSKSGKPFIEEELKGRTKGDYKRALIEDSIMGRVRTIETAYFCQFRLAQFLKEEDKDGCGWVKGRPVEKPYPLSGSAGIKYHCRVCDKEIGEADE